MTDSKTLRAEDHFQRFLQSRDIKPAKPVGGGNFEATLGNKVWLTKPYRYFDLNIYKTKLSAELTYDEREKEKEVVSFFLARAIESLRISARESKCDMQAVVFSVCLVSNLLFAALQPGDRYLEALDLGVRSFLCGGTSHPGCSISSIGFIPDHPNDDYIVDHYHIADQYYGDKLVGNKLGWALESDR